MARAKKEEIKNMTESELGHRVTTLKQELFKLRAEQSSGRIEKPHMIRQTKRQIARCLTILRERESGK